MVVAAAASTAAGSMAGSSDHGPTLWAGQWTTSTGGVAWREFTDGDLAIAKNGKDAAELFDRLPCKNGPRFFRGGYTAGGDRGKIMGCGTATHMRGRWRSNVGGQFQNGSYEIRITSRNPLAFKGTFRQDDGVTGPYTGTWASHFDGDGCCPAGANDDDLKPSATTKRHQTELRKLGFYDGPLDGRSSLRTQLAIKDFQRQAGIPADGRCAARCENALRTMLRLSDPNVSASAGPASRPTVKELQNALAKLGFYAGPFDGRNTARTIDAVKRFQIDAGIPSDGQCEQRCLLALTGAVVKR